MGLKTTISAVKSLRSNLGASGLGAFAEWLRTDVALGRSVSTRSL